MMVLVVDSISAATSPLARGIKNSLRCEVSCASSPQEALRRLRTEKDTIGVIVHSLELGPDAGLSFIQAVREHCRTAAIRVPRFLVLTPGPLTAAYDSRFRIMGAECLLLGFEQQVYASIRRIIFESVCEKGRPTIIVDRSGPEARFVLLGVARSELIRCGPRLLLILNYLAIHSGTEISTRTLAEVADITEAWVRVYMRRLRSRFDEARLMVGVEIPGKEVFRTSRRDGGFVHMLSARVMFA